MPDALTMIHRARLRRAWEEMRARLERGPIVIPDLKPDVPAQPSVASVLMRMALLPFVERMRTRQ